jgi:hypothetical protein
MMTRRRVLIVVAALAVWVAARPFAADPSDSLPSRLTDREFWQLFSDLSEPDGAFRSDNLISNEVKFQAVIPALMRAVQPGGAYLGVGPEQNFTYIAALRPKIAFIVDVRRGNADLHFMYKALFELSADRAEFVARLFSRGRPPNLSARSTAADLFAAFAGPEPNERVLTENLAAVRHQLVTVHNLPLSSDDLERIESIYRAFFLMGPKIQYSPYGSFGSTLQPTYAQLMVARDDFGEARAFLASEAAYAAVRDLERRNAIVPVVGDFAGPKALRAVGQYLRGRHALVSAFYLSNVEEYLQQNGVWNAFCQNVASLPIDDATRFIRSVRDGVDVPGFVTELSPIGPELQRCRA